MNEMASTGQASPSATLTCPNCQTSITYYDATGSSYYGCPNCHTFFKYENEEPPEILATFRDTNPTLALPIGTVGYLHGHFVRVVGWLHKKEAGTSYDWTEYILLRQDERYLQLAEYNGHWMIIEPTDESYQPMRYERHIINTPTGDFKLFNRYSPAILNAVGEFDWNILTDTTITVSEYVQPPYMLVSEESGDATHWYKARYITPTAVKSAFGLAPQSLPEPYGVGAIEPADPNGRWSAVLAFTGIMLVAVIAVQLLLTIVKPAKQLLSQSYYAESDSTGNVKPIITHSFDVDGPTALAFSISTNLQNQWVELPITLINEQSGRTYEFTKTLEYYSGVDGGESWSEGSQSDDAVLSRIPSGHYHLTMFPAHEAGHQVLFRVEIEQNTTLFSNLMLLIGLLAIFPIVLYWRRRWFENQRWSNSDYADQAAD